MMQYRPGQKLDFIPTDSRASRSRKADLSTLLARDPCCYLCGLDLVAMERRRARAKAAVRGAVDFLIEEGHGAPHKWLEIRDGRMEPGHPVFDALYAMGFYPNSPLGEVDHLKPLWAAGLDIPTNRAVACVPCHQAKTRREAKTRARMKRSARRVEPVPKPSRDRLVALMFEHRSRQKVGKVLGVTAIQVGRWLREEGLR